ncbi:bifunctional 4-hydroxy-2-oxoglutarate aldolase/2-dehydro-3-deoxy-phosphogluconate aldolase [Oscillatoria salina]|uniref:bifunctional 4-hydroxy-2-oxoglutarate aldolase/2-dehydro-3-deoxy-phosphogluconate aldolase n=1 Tax=Oscillatoria salina TaxID=331517 RepID=UPI0013B7FE24|nr:bifunctional 4-hydroxy-2-oxoglutarate aldolase/2-dehydro-3-deoxy-phosphogluconate aldolase [Oscillatoria salina]MBZ8181996.1 bifunctional 4-hydroxy-2-oxoglutarate aldolase/2-dehydro-3-deoxy-phosphogluconate aldolase [Oscillatoria salina IIICB1]NET89380.1 bifunctional 4-hydroxy-2-oxoglutarate aldolase/2-dehydro-3-deoxy-phosphogluconate aldolase [Kamptonema sp. SIO1D9]
MSEHLWLKSLSQYRAIAIIRAPRNKLGLQMAYSVVIGGMQMIEITWNSEKPTELVSQLRRELPGCIVGAGTILNKTQLREAIACGAKFIFTPHVDPVLIQAATHAGVPIVPGALTPTEIVTAWQAGASCVKVFPVHAMGGATYLKSLQAPLNQIPLIPSGGVSLKNAKSLIDAGAIAVGVSSHLFPKKLVATHNWEAIALRAKALHQQLTLESDSLD